VLGGSLARASGESIGDYAINSGSLALTDSNYTLAFAPGTPLLKIVPLVVPWQPTTLFAQAGAAPAPMLPSQLALLAPGAITSQWGSGNGPALTIVAGGVCMPDDRAERQ
jgi:hypothetical protein